MARGAVVARVLANDPLLMLIVRSREALVYLILESCRRFPSDCYKRFLGNAFGVGYTPCTFRLEGEP